MWLGALRPTGLTLAPPAALRAAAAQSYGGYASPPPLNGGGVAISNGAPVTVLPRFIGPLYGAGGCNVSPRLGGCSAALASSNTCSTTCWGSEGAAEAARDRALTHLRARTPSCAPQVTVATDEGVKLVVTPVTGTGSGAPVTYTYPFPGDWAAVSFLWGKSRTAGRGWLTRGGEPCAPVWQASQVEAIWAGAIWAEAI
jgi:hypothetical protein